MSSTLRMTVRIAALMAILACGLGKTLHLHQECGGCCGSTKCAAQAEDTPTRTVACPYGCESCLLAEQRHQPDSGDTDRQQQPPHDEHHCPICSVLAQAPDVPQLATAPELSEPVWLSPESRWTAPRCVSPIVAHSRGPPAGTGHPVPVMHAALANSAMKIV